MKPTLSEQQTYEALAHLVADVADAPPPLAAVCAEAERRRRRRRTTLLTAAAAVLVATGTGLTAAAITRGPTTARDTTGTPTTIASPSPTTVPRLPPSSGVEPSSDPTSLAMLQGAWTLRLTNVAPDGQPNIDARPDLTITFSADIFQTTDGTQAIQGHVTIGAEPEAGEAGELTTYDIRTASAAPAPGTPTHPPPVLATLENLGRFERDGDTLLLLAKNSAITAVLRPRVAGVGRIEATVHTQPALVADGTGGLRITLTPTAGGPATSTITDGGGSFGLDLAAGSYTVSTDSGVCTPKTPVEIRQYATTHGDWNCPAAPLVSPTP